MEVHDRVGEAARPARNRRRPVAHGDHLALPAGLEARRHQEDVGACVDPPGEVAIEALHAGHAPRVGCGRGPHPLDEARVAAAEGDDPRSAGHQPRRSAGDEVEALLRIEPADHAEDRRRIGRIEPDPLAQVAPAGGLPGAVPRVVGRGERPIVRRIPEALVQAVEDAGEVRPACQQVAVEAHPVLGTEHLARVRRAHGVDHLYPPDALAQEVDAPGVADWRVVAQPQLGNPMARRPAVIREVVDRQGDCGGADRRVRVVREVPQDHGRAGVPVVERDDVHRAGPPRAGPPARRGPGA